MKILIADDENLARWSLRNILQELSLPLELLDDATNGEEMVAQVRRHWPHIVFVDIKMPKLNGLEAIKAAKQFAPRTRWFILTGFPEFNYAQEALRMGVSDYLLKPVDPQELANVVTEVFMQSTDIPRPISQAAEGGELLVQAKRESGDILAQALQFIEQNYQADISIAQIAEKFHVTPNYLSTLFHKRTGMTFMKYLTKLRMLKAKELLTNTDIQVQQVAEQVGYYSVRHFTKVFTAFFGHYPSGQRRKG